MHPNATSKPEGQNRWMAHPGNRSRFRIRRQGSAAEPQQLSSVPEPALVPRDHAPVGRAVAGYILGPGDQISIHVLHVEEINDKPVPIDMSGEIRVPVVGRIQVADSRQRKSRPK